MHRDLLLTVEPSLFSAIVSEPLADPQEAWLEVPESTALVIESRSYEQRPFRPQAPGTRAAGKRPVGREV